MANEQRSDKIEAWLKGKLPATEAAEFENEMAADPALAEEVDLHRMTLYAIDHLSERHLKENVLAWMENVDITNYKEDPEKGSGSAPYRNWFFMVAALLILTGVFIIYQTGKSVAEKRRIVALEAEIKQQDSLLFELKQRSDPDPAKIDSLYLENERLRQQLLKALKVNDNPTGPFAYYSKPKDIISVVRKGEETTVQQLIIEGAVFFQQSDLKQAEVKAREALKIEGRNRNALRLLAHVLFGQQRFLEAEAEFSKMQKEYARSSGEAKEAEWNRLLCYRALSADASQRALFNSTLDAILKEPDHPYHNQAVQMKTAD